MVYKIQEFYGQDVQIAGIRSRGVPVAHFVAKKLDIPEVLYIEPHDVGRIVWEGEYNQSLPIVFCDDTINSGLTFVRVLEDFQDRGGNLFNSYCVIGEDAQYVRRPLSMLRRAQVEYGAGGRVHSLQKLIEKEIQSYPTDLQEFLREEHFGKDYLPH